MTKAKIKPTAPRGPATSSGSLKPITTQINSISNNGIVMIADKKTEDKTACFFFLCEGFFGVNNYGL